MRQMPLKRLRLLGMLITWVDLHRAYLLKGRPLWRRTMFKPSALLLSSSSSPGSDANRDKPHLSSSNNKYQSRLSQYYDEMFTTVDKKKSRISKPPPIITDLESADVYDLNSSDDNSSTSIDDESPHWNPDESWMDDSIDRNSRFRETFSSYTQEYQSLTHDLASSAHRKIPPSTLGYEDESSVRSTPRRKNMPNHPPNYNKITAQSALPIDTSRSSISFQSKAKAFNSSSARATDLKKTCEMTDIPDSPKTIIQPPFTSQLQIHQQPIDEMTTSNMNSFSSSSSTDSHYNQDRASLLTFLRNSLAKLELDMFTLNNNITFAINSRREVSKVLFGIENESINKDSLDALAGSNRIPANRIAGLLLSHRKLSRQLKQIEKDVEVIQLGVHSGRLSPETFDTNPTIKDGDFTISRPSPVSTPLSKDSDPLMLVDASAYIFRAYYSMPPIHRSDGMPVGAVLGFCNMINNLVLDAYIKGERPRLVLVFDSKDGSNLRKTLYPQYKGNRPPCPVDLIPQFDLIKNAADAYGIIKVEAPGHEADDVIATLATMAQKEGCSVNIYSADKDLMQLITRDSSVIMVDPMKLTSISYEVVVDKWNVTPEQLGDVLALAGDSSDNIPGVPGIGPKTAASLINEFGSLDELLLNLGSIKQKGRREKLEENRASLDISRRLVKLETTIPIKNMTLHHDFSSVNDLRMEPRTLENEERLLQFYSDMGLRDIARRVKGRLYQDQWSTVPTTTRGPSDNTISVKESIVNSHTTDDNTLLNKISFLSPRPKSPPGPMEYDDVPF